MAIIVERERLHGLQRPTIQGGISRHMTTTDRPRLLAVDWGTSSCRAYLLGENGAVLSERREPCGVLAVTMQAAASGTERSVAFEQAFERLCGDFLKREPELPVIACGMVGSNHGWVEAAYRPLPTDLAAGGDVLTPVQTRTGTTVHIIAGLVTNSALPGVMRGEETQILGAISHEITTGAPARAPDRIVLLPGTHSKWVRVSGTTVTDFTTCMTGEIFALLTTGSTLSRLATPADSPRWEAFDRGLDLAASPFGDAGILNTAFSARTLVLTGRLASDEVIDYLSGLLIGHELAGIAASWLGDEPTEILLCGDPELNVRYRRALESRGLAVALAIRDSAPAGMWQVADATGLISGQRGTAAPHPRQLATATTQQSKG
jgi:2-dehydro-3-deoxygalactonokinase